MYAAQKVLLLAVIVMKLSRNLLVLHCQLLILTNSLMTILSKGFD